MRELRLIDKIKDTTKALYNNLFVDQIQPSRGISTQKNLKKLDETTYSKTLSLMNDPITISLQNDLSDKIEVALGRNRHRAVSYNGRNLGPPGLEPSSAFPANRMTPSERLLSLDDSFGGRKETIELSLGRNTLNKQNRGKRSLAGVQDLSFGGRKETIELSLGRNTINKQIRGKRGLAGVQDLSSGKTEQRIEVALGRIKQNLRSEVLNPEKGKLRILQQKIKYLEETRQKKTDTLNGLMKNIGETIDVDIGRSL